MSQAPKSYDSKREIDEARLARLAQTRQAEQRRARRHRILRTGAIVTCAVTVVIGAGAVLLAGRDDAADHHAAASNLDPGKANVDGEQVYRVGRGHQSGGVVYPASPNPPVGGKHDPVWQNANGDVYDRPLRNEHAVHSLEHGAVWVTYAKDAPKGEVEKFRQKVDGMPHRMMSPVPDQDGMFKLTAWGHQLTVESAADLRVDQFFDSYVKGPQAPEPGAPVVGGRATP